MAKNSVDFFITEAAMKSGIYFSVREASSNDKSIDVKIKDGWISIISVLGGSQKESVAKNMIEAKRLLDKIASKMFGENSPLEYCLVKNVKNNVKVSPAGNIDGYEVSAFVRGEEKSREGFDSLNEALYACCDTANLVFVDEYNKLKEDLCDKEKIATKKKQRNIQSDLGMG